MGNYWQIRDIMEGREPQPPKVYKIRYRHLNHQKMVHLLHRSDELS